MIVIAAAAVSIAAQAPDQGSVSVGFASDLRTASPTMGCTNTQTRIPGGGVFPNSLGTSTSLDGRQWTVPAAVHDGPVAVDMFNNCTGPGDIPEYASKLSTVVIDRDGVEITGYIHADNYFELWVNGRFVGRDSIPMVPFNTSVVRFRARYPMTYAIKGVDWETHVGVGLEYPTFNVGDGGFLAYFSDGNGTHGDWRAETFYIAPLDDPACVRGRDSTFCSQAARPACAAGDQKTCKALHFAVPDAWISRDFDDSRWPRAIVWPAAAVTDAPAYTNYTRFFGDAEFIWTRNLKLDNLVLARYTARGPRR